MNSTAMPKVDSDENKYAKKEAKSRRQSLIVGIVGIMLIVIVAGGFWFLNPAAVGDPEPFASEDPFLNHLLDVIHNHKQEEVKEEEKAGDEKEEDETGEEN